MDGDGWKNDHEYATLSKNRKGIESGPAPSSLAPLTLRRALTRRPLPPTLGRLLGRLSQPRTHRLRSSSVRWRSHAHVQQSHLYLCGPHRRRDHRRCLLIRKRRRGNTRTRTVPHYYQHKLTPPRSHVVGAVFKEKKNPRTRTSPTTLSTNPQPQLSLCRCRLQPVRVGPLLRRRAGGPTGADGILCRHRRRGHVRDG